MSFQILIPEGYEVVETNNVVNAETAYGYTHFLHSTAESHAQHLNGLRVSPLYRYVVEPVTKEMRRHLQLGRLERWVVVPYQNVLQKKAYEPLDSTHTY